MKNSNNILGIEALKEQIKDMDIPEMRRELKLENLNWLKRNLGIKNSLHENFPKAISNIVYILKNYESIL